MPVLLQKKGSQASVTDMKAFFTLGRLPMARRRDVRQREGHVQSTFLSTRLKKGIRL